MKRLLSGTVLVSMLMLIGCTANEEEVGGLQQAICLPGDTECCNCNVPMQPCCCNSPIVIDLAGDGVKLTSWQEGVPDFPLRPWEPTIPHAWTEPDTDDAFLTWDSDENGKITSGIELFGDAMPQGKPPQGEKKNGFLALAQHDDNEDRVIDQRDFVYQEIRLWQDRNHDAISQPDELSKLIDHGIAGLSVNYSGSMKADEHGNAFRWSAPVYGTPESTVGMTAWDVLLTSPTPEEQKEHGITPIPVPRFRPVPEPEPGSIHPEVAPAHEQRVDSNPRAGLPPGMRPASQDASLTGGICYYRRHIWNPIRVDGEDFMYGTGNWDLNIAHPCDATQAVIRMRLRNQWNGAWHYVATKLKTVPEYNDVNATSVCLEQTDSSYWQTVMQTYLLGCPSCSPIDLGVFNAFTNAIWHTCNSFQNTCEAP